MAGKEVEHDEEFFDTDAEHRGGPMEDTGVPVEDDDHDSTAALDVDKASALVDMRKAVEELGETVQAIDDATLLRFLRARAFRIPKASKMFVQHQRWRREFVPHGWVSPSEIEGELAAEKTYLQGLDKERRPIFVIVGSRHVASGRNLEEFKRSAVHNIDKAIAMMPPGVETFTAILDMGKLAYKNLDASAMRVTFDFLQAYYPERLGRLYMLHVPYIFWPMWKMVSPFIHKETKSKILFVEDKNLDKVLREGISEDQLPELFGGKLKLVPVQDAKPSW